MATVITNLSIKELRGSIGNIVFRQVRGRTIMSGKPEPSEKQSALQRQNRGRFKEAALWAKQITRNPEKKAYYWRMAKKLKLPNAYTAALSDYLRKAEVKEVDTRNFKGRNGDEIRIVTKKKDYLVHNVNVKLVAGNGSVLAQSSARRTGDGRFVYRLDTHLKEPLVNVVVTIDDPSYCKEEKSINISPQGIRPSDDDRM